MPAAVCGRFDVAQDARLGEWTMRMMIAAGALILCGCTSVDVLDPTFGADTSASVLGDGRVEVGYGDEASQQEVFAAAREACGGEPVWESSREGASGTQPRSMTFRCLRPPQPPVRDNRLPPPILQQPRG